MIHLNIKTVLLATIMDLTFSPSLAQTFRHHEVAINFGLHHEPGRQFYKLVDRYCAPNGLKQYDPMCGIDIMGDSYYGMGLAYYYNINRNWTVGMEAGIARAADGYSNVDESEDRRTMEKPTEKEIYAGGASLIYYLMPQARYNWWISKTDSYRLYSGIAIGIQHQRNSFDFDPDSITPAPSVTERHWLMSYQITPIGLSMGQRDYLYFFLEIGYGAQGIVRAGFAQPL